MSEQNIVRGAVAVGIIAVLGFAVALMNIDSGGENSGKAQAAAEPEKMTEAEKLERSQQKARERAAKIVAERKAKEKARRQEERRVASYAEQQSQASARAAADAKSRERSELQKKRRELIDKLVNMGVFRKVRFAEGINPRVWVDENFTSLTVDQKESFLEVVLAYNWPESDGTSYGHTVVVKNIYTDEWHATFNLASGGYVLE